jgi:nicotinamidase-related amidase
MATARPERGARPARSLLAPDQCVLALIDHQGLILLGVESHPRQRLVNNVAGLAKTAKAFGVPTVITSAAAKTFSGPTVPEILAVFPEHEVIDRTTMNAWEDDSFVAAIEATGRRKIVMAGLWTEICVAYPALSAMEAGYEVYVVLDACGGIDREAHDASIVRMTQAGAIPLNWLGVLLEWQRDWARADTYGDSVSIIREHGGGYGEAVNFLFAMSGAAAG